MELHNWAGNLTYSTDNLLEPTTIEEAQEMIRAQARVRVLGTRHSFNAIADSPHALLSTQKLPQRIEIDAEKMTVTIDGGIKYGTLAEELHRQGFALHNLASLPHISVAGACATATHGSGVKNGNLATAVVAMKVITADGNIQSFAEGDEEFHGAVVHLGGLGMVCELTLRIEPTYQMTQTVYQNLAFKDWEANFEEILGAAYSVSLFTDWQHPRFNQVWIKHRVSDGVGVRAEQWHGATRETHKLHPLETEEAKNCTEQMGIVGAWHERLPHFRMDHKPSRGEELQTEYFVPHQFAVDALNAVGTLADRIAPLLFITEVRTVAADEFWMSPCYGQDSVGIHFTWKPEWEAVKELLPYIEGCLEPFGVRAHWGKLFAINPIGCAFEYCDFSRFRNFLERYDPTGKFRNEFLNTLVFV